jgi:phosphoribosylglycinamide formyltransferase-1
MKIGVFASHEGTTLQAVLDACAQHTLAAQVALVISNNSASGALRRAWIAHVPTLHVSDTTHPELTERDLAIRTALRAAEIDVVLLAGFMKKLGPLTLEAFAGRILNTHPALLPKFGGPGMFGAHVHRAVLASGDEVSGASVHLVEREYDTGPVIAQVRVKVALNDTVETLAQRVQAAERELVIRVLREFSQNRRFLPSLPDAEGR